jgi:hypothetical protein
VNEVAVNASAIVLLQISLMALTSGKQIFGSAPQAQDFRGLFLLYETMSTADEPLAGLGVSVLHIGDIDLPRPEIWRLCALKANYSNCVLFDSARFGSFALSLSTPGRYQVNASVDSIEGHLEGPGNDADFAVSGHSFFAKAGFVKSVASSKNRRLYYIIGGVAGGLVIVVIVIALIIVCRRRKPEGPDSGLISGSDRYTDGTDRVPKPSGWL